ncbi:nitronate monooxygenase [Gryllotalpicola protaetiae]|uniref:nitronate monooxygenase n=1 Tax=Gryllotalpicola protaetiae TaxID=2419771 RepID=UPI001FE36078|nr:nitronate monooxygenase [Gryllotalpicola protaetiae]
MSFTFALPAATAIGMLRRRGSFTIQTVTTIEEARAAEEAGVDALALQGFAAGGHSGGWDPRVAPAELSLAELVRRVHAQVGIPIIAAGGIGSAAGVPAARAAGAAAVSVGTAVLRASESGASAIHKSALADPAYTETVLTRAFTGRLARALPNGFVKDHGADAPIGYPAVHHLTRPIRAAATSAGDPSSVNLWAGRGFRSATDASARPRTGSRAG